MWIKNKSCELPFEKLLFSFERWKFLFLLVDFFMYSVGFSVRFVLLIHSTFIHILYVSIIEHFRTFRTSTWHQIFPEYFNGLKIVSFYDSQFDLLSALLTLAVWRLSWKHKMLENWKLVFCSVFIYLKWRFFSCAVWCRNCHWVGLDE